MQTLAGPRPVHSCPITRGRWLILSSFAYHICPQFAPVPYFTLVPVAPATAGLSSAPSTWSWSGISGIQWVMGLRGHPDLDTGSRVNCMGVARRYKIFQVSRVMYNWSPKRGILTSSPGTPWRLVTDRRDTLAPNELCRSQISAGIHNKSIDYCLLQSLWNQMDFPVTQITVVMLRIAKQVIPSEGFSSVIKDIVTLLKVLTLSLISPSQNLIIYKKYWTIISINEWN